MEEAIRERYKLHSKSFSGFVYRGAYISKEEWEKLEGNIGEEIEMSGFLSTSANQKIAVRFFESDSQNKIFITIIVPPLPEPDEQGFADVSPFSDYKLEKEILFNVRSRFRILEARISKIDARGTSGRHLVLLYGARALRRYMTKHKPVINLELKLPSEKKCKLCESSNKLFAFSQELRCLDCLIKSMLPVNTPLFALGFGNINEVITASFTGKLLAFDQALRFPYYGYKCYQCQKYGKEKYYKWINLETGEVFKQCSDCFEEKKTVDFHILIAEINPYVVWLECQREWETADTDYQTEVSTFVKDKDQGYVYLNVQKFYSCVDYQRGYARKLKRARWREEERLKILWMVGKANEGLGNYQKALEFYRKIADISQFRNEKKSMYASYDSLASAYRNLGQNQEALKSSTEALKLTQDIYGDTHQMTTIQYNNIALAYQNLGQYHKALEHFANALKVRKEIFGKNHPETAISYGNYALPFSALGQHQKAFEYQKRALDIRKAIFGDNHPDTADAYSNCAVNLGSIAKFQDALEFEKKALNIRRTIFGEKHSLTALSYHNYATFLDDLGKYHEAFEFYKKALDIRETILQDKHPDLADSYSNLGVVFLNLKSYQEALKYFKKALSIRKDISGNMHSKTVLAYSNCAVALSHLGEHEKALEFHRKVLDIRKTLFGDEHSETADSYHNVAAAYQDLGKHKEAFEYFKEAISIWRIVFDEKHRHAADSHHKYAISCEELGKYKEALDSFKKAWKISQEVLGNKHPNTIEYRKEFEAACYLFRDQL